MILPHQNFHKKFANYFVFPTLQIILNLDNYYTQVIATGTEWQESISGVEEIASYRCHDYCSTEFYITPLSACYSILLIFNLHWDLSKVNSKFFSGER